MPEGGDSILLVLAANVGKRIAQQPVPQEIGFYKTAAIGTFCYGMYNWMKKAASPPKILQILFILSKNKIGSCRAQLSGYFLQEASGAAKRQTGSYRRTPFGVIALGYFGGSAEQGSAIHLRRCWRGYQQRKKSKKTVLKN